MNALKWLEKATFATSDLSGGSDGGLLAPEQAKEFLRVAIEESKLLRDLNVFTSMSTRFEVPRISFADRILRVASEGNRLGDSDRVKPTTGLVTLSTANFKGEVPVTDETFEDNIEREGLADTLATMIAEAIGRDVEELVIKSDTSRDPGGTDPAADTVLDQFDGLIAQMQDNLASGQKIDSTALTTYEDIFSAMIAALPAKYRRNYNQLRFYVPTKHRDGYIQELGGRGTVMGDSFLVDGAPARLAYRGIPVEEVPLMSGTSTIGGGAVDYSTFVMLLHPMNVYLGFHRRVRMEKWRDPREGVTSFLPSVRFDVKMGDPAFGVLGYNIPL